MTGAVSSSKSPSSRLVHCFDCDQSCCRTAVVEVDPPRALRDYSDLLFYLYHDDTRIVAVKSSRGTQWFVEFASPCRYLVDGRCSVYDTRPQVCRDYDMRHCERNTRRRLTTMRSPEDFYAYLRRDNRTRVADRLAATHKPPKKTKSRKA